MFAVKGYCSALSHIFALGGIDVVASDNVSVLMRNFESSHSWEIWPPAEDVTLLLQFH